MVDECHAWDDRHHSALRWSQRFLAIALGIAFPALCAIALDGYYDTTWGNGGFLRIAVTSGFSDVEYKMTTLSDGRLLAIGACVPGTGAAIGCATRLLEDGSYDPSFGPLGDGRLSFTSFPDFLFGEEGAAKDMAVLSDGSMVIVGTAGTSGMIAKLRSDGTPDTSVGQDGLGWSVVWLDGHTAAPSDVRAVVVQPDGKIIVAGIVAENVNNDIAVMRLLPDLVTIDTTFGNDGVTVFGFDLVPLGNDEINAIALQPDGKIVMVGSAELGVEPNSAASEFAAARLSSDGSLDPTFGSQGMLHAAWGTSTTGRALHLMGDGRLLVGGCVGSINASDRDFAVNRLLPDGAQDPSFGGGAPVVVAFDLIANGDDALESLAVQSDEKILLAGAVSLDSADFPYEFGVVRLTSSGTIDPSFGLNGRSVGYYGTTLSYGNSISVGRDGIFVGGLSLDNVGLDNRFGFSKLQLDLLFANAFER